ncbi:MAG: GLUG motif-containing protein [Planctomycetota bacterium]|jgi:hypothetical protein
MKKTTLFALLLTCILTMPTFAKYSGGTGTELDPYLISTPEDMNAIGTDPCDWDKYFLLTADINMAGYTYTTALIAPDTDNTTFSFQGTKFTGVFDGAGFKIINLIIDTAGADNDYLGLFGGINFDGRANNLGVEDANITGGDDSYCLGGLAGYNYHGTITNCYSTSQITGRGYLGGLVGGNSGTISDCFSTGSVTGANGSRNLGGLVGLNEFGTIRNCDSTSQVTGGNGSRSLGGLVGNSTHGTIRNCYTTGSVTGGAEHSDYLGGLVGHNSEGTISDCFSTGSVTSGDYSHELGGLVGENYKGTISDCFSTASVTGGDYFGGLCGDNYGTIINCYAIGSVTGGNDSWRLGGLVGENGTKGTITNCYATGQVTGGNESGSLGGLVGNNRGTISNCFWDVNTSGLDTSAGGIGKTTEQMQTKSTFTDAGWDFTTPVWKICETADYPQLAWQKIPASVLYPEPDITTGSENTISWQQVNEAIEYYAICCNDPNLEELIMDTGWIDANEVTFAGLNVGQTYYYAVKARQNCVMESDWSNVESSMQGTLGDAVDIMLDPNSLKNANMANALSNKIDEVLAMIEAGNYQAALKKLENDILKKTDGCANNGQPDKNDWIVTCQQQGRIYPLIMETIEYVESLIE